MRLTPSKNSAQSKAAIVRMLVITLRTVTFMAAWFWSSTAHELVGRRSRRRELLVEPGERGHGLGILVTQTLDELDGERGRQCGGVKGSEREGPGRLSGEAEELVRQGVGLVAGGASLDDPLGEPPQVLHEHDPEGDGHGPQLADGQGLHALESADEALQRIAIEAAVGVCDERPGQAEHAWIPLQRPVGKLGELAVEPGREILPDLPDDLVHDVEVVDEPFRRRRDRAFLPDHPGERAIALEQDAPAVPHAWRQGAADPAFEQGPLARDPLCVLLESVGAEQLVPDGILGVENGRGRGGRHSEAPQQSLGE